MGPLVEVLGEPLVGVLNATVEVAHLVVVHLREVPVVEVLREALPERHRQQLAEVLHCRVNGRGRDREEHQTEDLHCVHVKVDK